MSGKSWVQQHKKELWAAAAIAGAGIGGPALLGALAPEAAAGAVAGDAFLPGALGAGGSAMGSGLLGAGTAAGMAGDAYMPGATMGGMGGADTGSMLNSLGIKGMPTGAQATKLAGLLGQGGGMGPQPMSPMQPPPRPQQTQDMSQSIAQMFKTLPQWEQDDILKRSQQNQGLGWGQGFGGMNG